MRSSGARLSLVDLGVIGDEEAARLGAQTMAAVAVIALVGVGGSLFFSPSFPAYHPVGVVAIAEAGLVGAGAFTLARTFAELHQGRLEVESEPGRGATFRLTIPLAS
ncbi:MAG: Histidine kinase, gyrase and HSP90-like ATPase [Actinomycetota bacterium]